MDLTYYKPTDLENWIIEQYQDNGIYRAADLDIDHIADLFDIEIHTHKGQTFATWAEGEYRYIILNEDLSPVERREQFFHELCHPLKHVGHQKGMSKEFMIMQEAQASCFQLYAAMPYYLLTEFADIQYYYDYLHTVAKAFTLPVSLVRRRLEQIQRRIYSEKFYRGYQPVKQRVEHEELDDKW